MTIISCRKGLPSCFEARHGAALLFRTDIDPKRVGVAGPGLSGMRAWMLMSLDERITCGVAVSGTTRLSDWLSANGQDGRLIAPWAAGLLRTFDSEAVMALCAPRRLHIASGDRDPFAPASGFEVFRKTVGKVYGLHDEGRSFTATLFKGSGGQLTREKWDSLLETFDNEFSPKGPARSILP